MAGFQTSTLNQGLFSSKTPEWDTPQDVFEDLDREFHFTIDVCSTDENQKVKNHLTGIEGLLKKWEGVVWMNPPYGRQIGKWISKAYASAQEGATVVCLLPSRTDTSWWHEYVMRGEIRFVRGRLYFGNGTGPAPFPSVVVIFRPAKSQK